MQPEFEIQSDSVFLLDLKTVLGIKIDVAVKRFFNFFISFK